MQENRLFFIIRRELPTVNSHFPQKSNYSETDQKEITLSHISLNKLRQIQFHSYAPSIIKHSLGSNCSRNTDEMVYIFRRTGCNLGEKINQRLKRNENIPFLIAAFKWCNAIIYTFVIAMAKINKLKFNLLPYVHCSPDIFPSDYFLFQIWKI